jgi:hypothetical protein
MTPIDIEAAATPAFVPATVGQETSGVRHACGYVDASAWRVRFERSPAHPALAMDEVMEDADRLGPHEASRAA